MAKIKGNAAQVASKNSASFLEVMASTPEFKQLNPHIRLVDGKFENVPSEPPKKVVPLPDPGGKRREKAMTEAAEHMLAVSDGLVLFTLMESGQMETLEHFSHGLNIDIVQALAIRLRSLNSALLATLVGDIDGSELQGVVRFGSSI
jgi:hypothetical protein